MEFSKWNFGYKFKQIEYLCPQCSNYQGVGFIKMECLELSWIKIKNTKPGVSI